MILLSPTCATSRPIPRGPPWATCSKPNWIAAAALWPPCWCATARCTVGDYFICGSVFGKVRAMFDDRGDPCAKPGLPRRSKSSGLESLPEVGDTFQVVTDTAKAKQIVIYREAKARDAAMSKSSRMTLEQLHEQLKAGEVKELNIILKTDVGGTAEVLSEMMQKLSNEKVAHPRTALRRWAPSTKATCCWRRPRTPSSSASTSGRSATPPPWRSRKKWISGCTPSSTN